MKLSGVAIAFGLTASLAATGASGQATLNRVKQKGFLVCGSNPALPGFGMPDAQGNWTGFDIDYLFRQNRHAHTESHECVSRVVQ